VFVSARRDGPAARRFFTTAIAAHGEPVEAVTDRSPTLASVIDELLPDGNCRRSLGSVPGRGDPLGVGNPVGQFNRPDQG